MNFIQIINIISINFDMKMNNFSLCCEDYVNDINRCTSKSDLQQLECLIN
jgi:hypothetical protein